MKKNISEIQGAQFPESVEINQWVAELNGDYAYFVGRITVLSEKQCMVVTKKMYDLEEEEDFERNLLLDGKELLIADTLEDIKIDIEREDALRKIEQKKQVVKVVASFKSILEYYRHSDYDTDTEVRNELKSLPYVSDIRSRCLNLLPEPTKNYYDMFITLRNIVRCGYICFDDTDNHGISTSIPLSAIEQVCTRMTYNDKDAVEVRAAGKTYYIYKKNEKDLFDVLNEFYG